MECLKVAHTCLFPPNVTLQSITAAALSTRRALGINPKGRVLQQLPLEKGCTLPEYLKASGVHGLIDVVPSPQSRLVLPE